MIKHKYFTQNIKLISNYLLALVACKVALDYKFMFLYWALEG